MRDQRLRRYNKLGGIKHFSHPKIISDGGKIGAAQFLPSVVRILMFLFVMAFIAY